jgi:hypothetical protein
MPRKYSLNWFMPALVNSNVGSFFITMGADGTILCDLDSKKFKNCSLTCWDVIRGVKL